MTHFGISETSHRMILETIEKFPEIEKVILFGSRAKGNYRHGSDIDLAIFGANCTVSTAMSLSGTLNEEVPIPYHVDVVCYDRLNHADLKEHIDRVGVVFFERKLATTEV